MEWVVEFSFALSLNVVVFPVYIKSNDRCWVNVIFTKFHTETINPRVQKYAVNGNVIEIVQQNEMQWIRNITYTTEYR